ncbi:homoserine O-acetyltransferase [Starmerella bacillaris]|uniref:Homoserine O-acetyltransferase n=1 Tax=Starmerella bacillaris TaxID=1247836 RepID=A0AAV5RK95_STABA|nr:homoserine O-acetyltransferase [Starmerella bacillaris]
MSEANAQNPFVKLVNDQKYLVLDELKLECKDVLYKVPVAYKTWGKLNEDGTNCMVVCHALSGSADVADWWGPLLGEGRALDPTRFFIVCINALGSPYGTASPVTINPETGKIYGPEFPLTTIKDDSTILKRVLDHLNVNQVAIIIGGSMGGMLAQEFLYYGKKFVRSAVLLATSAYHSAWGISWGETQRQSIYCDPKYLDGYYEPDDPPTAGLGAARMTALMTYRTRDSFNDKFGRKLPDPSVHKNSDKPDARSLSKKEENWIVNNHGNPRSKETNSGYRQKSAQTYFTAQSYLRYQAQKFTQRFDANCYISITRKLDTHDLSRGRTSSVGEALGLIEQPALVIGIQSDELFTFPEQVEIQKYIKDSELKKIVSPDGHDAFLLEFELINGYILDFMNQHIPEFMQGAEKKPIGEAGDSIFGEDEVTIW